MVDDPEEQGGGEDSETGILVRRISPAPEDAEHELVSIIAELEDRQIDELPALYHEVDHMVENLFKTPPSSQAHMSLSFSYAGYRVTLDQDGALKLVPVKETVEESGRQ